VRRAQKSINQGSLGAWLKSKALSSKKPSAGKKKRKEINRGSFKLIHMESMKSARKDKDRMFATIFHGHPREWGQKGFRRK
jgi:hypothetical protein